MSQDVDIELPSLVALIMLQLVRTQQELIKENQQIEKLLKKFTHKS